MHGDNLTSQPKKWCKEQKLLKGVGTIMIGFKNNNNNNNNTIFVSQVCFGETQCKFRGFAKFQLLSDVSPDWLNALLRSMFETQGTFKTEKQIKNLIFN